MKNILYLACLLITTVSLAQTPSLQIEKQKLKQAIAYGDKGVAITAMYNIVALEGPQSTYKDSLAYMYFNARNYVSCFLVTNDVLEQRPENLELLEMNAISLESMGALEKATEAYAALFDKTKNNYHAYKLAGLQFGMKKNDEAYASIKLADQLPDNGTMQVNFQVNKNYNQNVSLKAAIAYLEGLIALNLNKEKEAKVCFDRAITLFPEFALAKGKLETLKLPE